MTMFLYSSNPCWRILAVLLMLSFLTVILAVQPGAPAKAANTKTATSRDEIAKEAMKEGSHRTLALMYGIGTFGLLYIVAGTGTAAVISCIIPGLMVAGIIYALLKSFDKPANPDNS